MDNQEIPSPELEFTEEQIVFILEKLDLIKNSLSKDEINVIIAGLSRDLKKIQASIDVLMEMKNKEL